MHHIKRGVCRCPLLAPLLFPIRRLFSRGSEKEEEKDIQKTIDAYRKVAQCITDFKPETIVLTSPHSVMYADYFHISPGESAWGDMRQFGAPDVEIGVEYDTEFVQELSGQAKKHNLPAGTMGERKRALDHGTLIPLYFLNMCYTDYRLCASGFPVYRRWIITGLANVSRRQRNPSTGVWCLSPAGIYPTG